MARLCRFMEQLAALNDGVTGDAERVAQLERVLDFDHVASHVRRAVAQAELACDPVPHLTVAELLPSTAYKALIEAIPPPVFFDGEIERGQEVRVPPRLAPLTSIMTWSFLTDVVVRPLVPMLIARFEEPLGSSTRARFPSLPSFADWDVEIALIDGRIVRRLPGYSSAVARDRSRDFLSGVLHLARIDDGEDFGSSLHGRSMPFRANTLLVFHGPAGAHAYLPIPTAVEAERYAYEFGVRLTPRDRARLADRSAKGQGPDGIGVNGKQPYPPPQ